MIAKGGKVFHGVRDLQNLKRRGPGNGGRIPLSKFKKIRLGVYSGGSCHNPNTSFCLLTSSSLKLNIILGLFRAFKTLKDPKRPRFEFLHRP